MASSTTPLNKSDTYTNSHNILTDILKNNVHLSPETRIIIHALIESGEKLSFQALNLVEELLKENQMLIENNHKLENAMYKNHKQSGILKLALNSKFPFPPKLKALREETREAKARAEKAETAAKTDGLTGLPNRAYFDEKLKQNIDSAIINKQPLSLIMLDIDHFKKVNDIYGHISGDKCLQEVAKALNIREGDFAARYGGEEFAVILPNTPIEKARSIAERIRTAIEKHEVLLDNNQKINVTASFGVITDENILLKKPERLVNAADRVLYMAKNQGRNRVIAACTKPYIKKNSPDRPPLKHPKRNIHCISEPELCK